MSKAVSSSLKTAVKGTALLAVSIAVGQAMWFFIRIIIVRNITPAEFGIYTLAVTLIPIAATVANLGLFEGAARTISVARGRGEDKLVKSTIKGSLEITSIASTGAALAIFFLSDVLAVRVFEMPALSVPLKVVAFGVLVTAMLNIIAGILRGFGIVGLIAVNAIVYPLLYIAFLAVVFLLKLPFMALVTTFVMANLLILVGNGMYVWRRFDFREMLSGKVKANRRKLLAFSLPLLGVSLTGIVTTWIDTVMIGYFMQAEDVGVFNVGVSLSQILLFSVSILGFVFMPIAGELYARHSMADLKRTYQVLTKWAFAATFPLFLTFFFFSEITLVFIFGAEYQSASTVLKLLSLSVMLNLLVGSCGLILTVIGRTGLNLAIVVAGVLLNVVLNYFFIPYFGLPGAAAATLLADLVSLGLAALAVYRLSGIHPFTPGHLKPVAAASFIAIAIYAVAKSIPLHFWMLPLYFAVFIGGYLAAILFTRSIEEEDVEMFDNIAWRMGVELRPIKKLLRKFVHE